MSIIAQAADIPQILEGLPGWASPAIGIAALTVLNAVLLYRSRRRSQSPTDIANENTT
jgi:membrane protein implicated in regulation of membrane protease activity